MEMKIGLVMICMLFEQAVDLRCDEDVNDGEISRMKTIVRTSRWRVLLDDGCLDGKRTKRARLRFSDGQLACLRNFVLICLKK